MNEVQSQVAKALQNLDLDLYSSDEAALKGERDICKSLCASFFKDDDGRPFALTDGQADIFGAILFKRHRRVQVLTYTQYGKSETVAMAIDLRSIAFEEDFTIVAGQQDKADIIMNKAVAHLFDHPALTVQIDPLGVPKLERLKHEKSQTRITFKDGGSIRALTASANNRKRVKETITGQGARNIVQDEASLIPDDLQAMIMRMLGGFKDSFLLKIGNPFYRNHFMKTWNSDSYHKIFIDYQQGIAEGRLSQEFVEEMRPMPFFDVLYECKFPGNDEILTGGYRRLVPDTLLEGAFISEEEFQAMCTVEIEDSEGHKVKVPEGQPRSGSDFAGRGSDKNAHVVRWPKVMKLYDTNNQGDTMTQVPVIENMLDDNAVEDRDHAQDHGGLGQGVGDRLHEKERFVNLIMFGQSAPDPKQFKNMRAYMYYELRKWLVNGGKIVRHDGFYELLVVNYKEDSERKFQIQPKEELKKIMKELGLEVSSPDVGDAAALTFADNTSLVDEDDFEFI